MNGALAHGHQAKGQFGAGAVHNGGRRQAENATTRAKQMYDIEGNLDKGRMVETYAPLVKRVAYHLMAKLPASVQVDDIIQNGMMGLLDAINRYEEGLGAQFETYAVQRVRGAMLDGLREDDWAPRSMRRDMRRIEAAMQTLEQRHGRPPTEIELAEALDVSLAGYQRMLQDARGHQLVYFEDYADGVGDDFFEHHVVDQGSNPLDMLEDADMRDTLVRAIEDLPEREKLVMGLYYDQELNLREIGEVLGVSESRVCQLHGQAVARLRARVAGAGASEDAGAPKPARRRSKAT